MTDEGGPLDTTPEIILMLQLSISLQHIHVEKFILDRITKLRENCKCEFPFIIFLTMIIIHTIVRRA